MIKAHSRNLGCSRTDPQCSQCRCKSHSRFTEVRAECGGRTSSITESSRLCRSQIRTFRPRQCRHGHDRCGRSRSLFSNLQALQRTSNSSKYSGCTTRMRLLFWERTQRWAVADHGQYEWQWTEAGKHRTEADCYHTASKYWSCYRTSRRIEEEAEEGGSQYSARAQTNAVVSHGPI
jgi:hypothetical protein